MADVLEINRLDHLEDYRLVWNALHAQTRSASFFQTLDWLAVYWKHFGRGQRLRTLIVSSDGKPIGILPLTVIQEPTRLGRLRVLTYPLHDWGSYYGPIGPNPTATLTAAMHYLAAAPRDWDLLDLRWVDDERVDHGRTMRAMHGAGFSAAKQPWRQTAVIETGVATWEQYFAGRSSKFRSRVRRSNRRFDELPGAKFIRYRPLGAAHGEEDPRFDLYDQCEQVAARSWQGQSKTGTTLSHESVRPFLREAHCLAAKNGMLDVCLLLHDGGPAAFGYNYHCQGYVTGMRSGFVPELGKVSPGLVLYARALADSFARGDNHYDLGPGYFETKRPWMTASAASCRVTHYPATPTAQLLRMKHWWSRGRRPAAAKDAQPPNSKPKASRTR